MTALESRIAALEVSIVILCDAIQQVATTQTMFSSVVTAHLREMLAQVKQLRDEFGEGDEWKDFT